MNNEKTGIPALLAAAKLIAENTTAEDTDAMIGRMCKADKQGEAENLARETNETWLNRQYTI